MKLLLWPLVRDVVSSSRVASSRHSTEGTLVGAEREPVRVTLAGTGSRWGTPSSSSAYRSYRVATVAVHRSRSVPLPPPPAIWTPAKCELCRCSRSATVVLTRPSVVTRTVGSPVKTTMLFNVSFRSALGRDGGELQLARRTSPGSYRLCSVHRVGPLSGSSTTCIWRCPVAVEKSGASAVTSQEKFPDSPNPMFRITTWLAFERDRSTLMPGKGKIFFSGYSLGENR
uniref:(northern house mosquito) hypothetical protein n=1 Tax=Culex pipiens TaxID=7175 RepID=A0A8D8CDS1_CULPI